MLAINEPGPVAVLDDIPYLRDELAEHIQESGLATFVILDIPGTAQAAARLIRSRAHYVVCDQRLGPFEGAEVIADVTDQHGVGVLVTQYDVGDDVPRYRHLLDKIPKQMSRAEFQLQDVREIFAHVEWIMRNKPPERKPYKAMIRVSELMGDGAMRVVVPAWDPRQEVEMYRVALPREERDLVKPGSRLWGTVNLRATSENELFITNVHLRSDPDPSAYPLRYD